MVNSNFANVGDAVFERIVGFHPEFSGYAVGYGLDSFFGPLQVNILGLLMIKIDSAFLVWFLY